MRYVIVEGGVVINVAVADAPLADNWVRSDVLSIGQKLDGTFPEQVTEDLSKQIRAQRNDLLTQSDWIVIKSYETGTSIPQDWQDYRQALRDITAQDGFPYSVEWPTKP